ncbi:MAG: two-component sensor histidine kinase [Candidatus Thioglobus sp.]|nr:two-component sensor histidine kinase [Candidatus Thioglobus pontius]MBL6977274.1 two-component sensor histidine kinase [Candidatus Thioglobus sp.]MBL6984152.1 two-component sensor histidine kinase [Candidatus Thioglobus sp.]
MLSKHELVLTNINKKLAPSDSFLPYLHLLKSSLNAQYPETINIKTSTDSQNEDWYWVDIPTKKTTVRFGFARSRIGVNPPAAFFITLIVGVALTLATAIFLTRRLAKPIDRLYTASQLIGHGQWPDQIKEEGPTEFIILTKQFNKMNLQVQQLLANRTTLLSGIAHDLRTPLTQINLALSLLPDQGGDARLMDSIQQDLDNINHLISDALDVGLGLSEEQLQQLDIYNELLAIINTAQSNDIQLNLVDHQKCMINIYPVAFRRIITNLISNAIRYGDNKPIEISLACNDSQLIIEIIDNGSGIDQAFREKVFQPFYRLEKSRNSDTGGSGLGLAIVRQLAETHNWTVELSSSKNGGTKATVVIDL